MASRTVMVLPGCRPSLEGDCEAAKAETFNSLFSFSLPALICSNSR
jgi:hypothetical protein